MWIAYENGEKVRQEELLDPDGSRRVRYTFRNGKVIRKEVLRERRAASPKP